MKFLYTEKPSGKKRNRPLRDYAGDRFGHLVAISLVERDPVHQHHKWLMRCDCGAEKPIDIKSCIGGYSTSCGCEFRRMIVERNTSHGLTKSAPREYRSWKDMRSRCRNPNNSDFKDYGGRGISICDRWDSFADFFADMGQKPHGFTLDRINVDGNYEPTNCRWASDETQQNNKRNNIRLTHDGVTKTIEQWSREFGILRSTVDYRIRAGMSFDQVFSRDDFRG